MSGYLSGLSWPSGTERIIRFRCAPVSNSAGQTRLPTFSIKTTECSAGGSASSARSIMAASRWQHLPVLICSARVPVARMRSASLSVSWSPSITMVGTSESALSVAQRSSVFPDPGLETRFSASAPSLAKSARFLAATASLRARMSSSIEMARPADISASCECAGWSCP